MNEFLKHPNAKALVRAPDNDPYGVAVPTDTERLDWIEANRACVGHHKETDWYSRAGRSFKTVRAAIDAAMRPSCSAK